jgi:hypothetical protein
VQRGGIFALKESVVQRGFRVRVLRRRAEVKSHSTVRDCCGYECDDRSSVPAHLSAEALPRRRSCGYGSEPWWTTGMVNVVVVIVVVFVDSDGGWVRQR